MSEYRRDPVVVAFEIMLSEFCPVKRASIMERVELALEQNQQLPLYSDLVRHRQPPVRRARSRE